MNKNESKYFNTAKKMNDALITLLDKKDFAYITVKDICNEAKVNRSTFYLHYENTMDLLEEVILSLNKSFANHFKEIAFPDVDNANLNDLIFINDKELLPYLNFIKENRTVYKALKNNPRLFTADKYQKATYDTVVSKILDRFYQNPKIKNYSFCFYVNGINALILAWCNNDCDLSVNEIAALIKELILK